MEGFSERMGYRTRKTDVQLTDMDQDLRNSLWNALISYAEALRESGKGSYKHERELYKAFWIDYFKKPQDELPIDLGFTFGILSAEKYMSMLKPIFMAFKWYDVYDFIEFIVVRMDKLPCTKSFIDFCNEVLERERSGYRFVGFRIAPITNELEIDSVSFALSESPDLIKIHLDTSIRHMSDRRNPDLRNSIKESISAVESMCGIVTKQKKAELGDALKVLLREGKLNKTLKKAFDILYGYTSGQDGIRHGLMNEPNLGLEEARFFLVACSAFINFIRSKTT